MDFSELLKNPWVWVAIVGLVIGGFGYVMYPQDVNQNFTPTITDYNQSSILDVVVLTQDEKTALKEIEEKYPEYEVLSKFYMEEKRAWAFRLQLKGGAE